MKGEKEKKGKGKERRGFNRSLKKRITEDSRIIEQQKNRKIEDNSLVSEGEEKKRKERKRNEKRREEVGKGNERRRVNRMKKRVDQRIVELSYGEEEKETKGDEMREICAFPQLHYLTSFLTFSLSPFPFLIEEKPLLPFLSFPSISFFYSHDSPSL